MQQSCVIFAKQTITMIPQTFDEWKRCIEVDCGLRLTSDFIQRRIAELADDTHPETRKFVRLYGDDHLQRVRAWFQQALVQ
jgi:hypothetical protein